MAAIEALIALTAARLRPLMDRTQILWTLTVFFGATVAFGLIRNFTEDQSAGVTVGAQAVAMLLIIGVVVAVVRYQERK